MRGRRLEGTKVDRDRQRQQVIEEVGNRQATEGGTVAQLKVASKRRVQVAMEGKVRER